MSFENSSVFIGIGLMLFLFRKLEEQNDAKIKTVEYDGIHEGAKHGVRPYI